MKENNRGVEYCPKDGIPVTPDGLHYDDLILGTSRTLVVIKTPTGPAPENIRQAWIGLELEGWPNAELLFDLDGKKKYLVPREHAMRVLRNSEKNEAANWFEDNWDESVDTLSFGVDEMLIIKEITRAD